MVFTAEAMVGGLPTPPRRKKASLLMRGSSESPAIVVLDVDARFDEWRWMLMDAGGHLNV